MTTIYNSAKTSPLSGDFDFDSDVLRLALISDAQAYTPDPDTEQFVDDVLGVGATEFSDASYSRQTLTGKSVTQDNTNDRGVADADDVTFASLDGDTIASALLYVQVGGDDSTPGDDPLVAHFTSVDFPITANGGDVDVAWDATDGVLYLG